MPHLQLDHSPELNPAPLLKLLTDEFCKIETVDPASVKAYCRAADAFVPGYLAPEGFVHLTICVLEGRPQEVLIKMSDSLYAVGKNYLAANTIAPISWTIEVREMKPQTYRKGTVG